MASTSSKEERKLGHTVEDPFAVTNMNLNQWSLRRWKHWDGIFSGAVADTGFPTLTFLTWPFNTIFLIIHKRSWSRTSKRRTYLVYKFHVPQPHNATERIATQYIRPFSTTSATSPAYAARAWINAFRPLMPCYYPLSNSSQDKWNGQLS